MNVKERLRQAYENVSLSGDRTWTCAPDAFQKHNLALQLRESQVGSSEGRRRPRSVRESIPASRLARYGNYVYSEAREMSYACSNSSCDVNVTVRVPNEPWEVPEVGDLYRWFLKSRDDFNFDSVEARFESPFLKVNGFEEKLLKLQLSEGSLQPIFGIELNSHFPDRVKNIWNTDSRLSSSYIKAGEISANLAITPMKNMYLLQNEKRNHEWFRQVSLSRDFEQLEQLSNAFKAETELIAKYLNGAEIPPAVETPSSEVLYSEVLQGVSPSRRLMALKSEPKASTDEATSSQDTFTNYTVLNSQRTWSEDSSNLNSQSQKATSASSSDKSVPHKPPNPCPQSDQMRFKAQPSQFQVDSAQRNSRTVIHQFTASFVPQTAFFPSMQTVQRVVGPFISASCRRVAPGEERTDFAEEHPPSTSISEELEIQALEQYSNSNDNFYQELEKQAEEQYASSPE